MCHTPLERRRGAHLVSYGETCHKYHWVCDAWPVRRHTCGYLLRASPPLAGTNLYCLVNRGTRVCVNNLPRVATWSGAAGTRTCDLSVVSPTTSTTLHANKVVDTKSEEAINMAAGHWYIYIQSKLVLVVARRGSEIERNIFLANLTSKSDWANDISVVSELLQS